ncbi:MAG: phosphatase [Gammaproteobacteria bacterium]|nr:MAG: phosphatase [Gammaproteobacteria bacterium]
MTQTRPNIAIFDIDGTLTDSVRAHQIAFEAALRDFNFPALRTDWGSYRHHSDSAILAEAWTEAGREGAADLARLEESYARHYRAAVTDEPFEEIPGTRAFLEHLRAHGWVLAFATGSLRSGALHKLAVAGVDGNAEILVTASELETREQIVGRAVDLACEIAGAAVPGRVISIGDGVWDLKTARNLGYEFLGIGFTGKGAKLKEMGASVHHDFNEVMSHGPEEFRPRAEPHPVPAETG